MIYLILFIFVAYGASNIMIYGSIFSGWRRLWGTDKDNPSFFGKLFGCFMCLSFWWGIILSITMFSPTLASGLLTDFTAFGVVIPKTVLSVFFDACFASGGVWLVHTIQERIEE